MRVVLQRVLSASVSVDNEVIGKIGKGYMLLVGVGADDTEKNMEKMADKISKMRLFADSEGKTNLSIADVDGEILVVSQFTLYADCKKGTRPCFVGAGNPEHANKLYEYFIKQCEPKFKNVQHGKFGADMQVSLMNDGPFTLYLEN